MELNEDVYPAVLSIKIKEIRLEMTYIFLKPLIINNLHILLNFSKINTILNGKHYLY